MGFMPTGNVLMGPHVDGMDSAQAASNALQPFTGSAVTGASGARQSEAAAAGQALHGPTEQSLSTAQLVAHAPPSPSQTA
jgi:hypothetical protein